MFAEMPTRAEFEDPDTLREFLAKQLRNGRLALLLGAGASAGMGLPDWVDLIHRLFAAEGDTPPSGQSPSEAAELFRLKHCGSDQKLYKAKVHRALWGTSPEMLTLTNTRNLDTLRAIGALAMASRRGSASLITFNFDDTLERYLEYHGFDVRAVSEPFYWSGNEDVTIYHPHGYLPAFLPPTSFSNSIVFAQDEFDAATGRAEWPWHPVLETILRSHTCLFIGLSGKDPNLSSLMSDMVSKNINMKQGNSYWGISFRTARIDDRDFFWEGRRVFRMEVTSLETALPEFLFELCRHAADL